MSKKNIINKAKTEPVTDDHNDTVVEQKRARFRAIIKLAVLVVIIVGVPLYVYFFQYDKITYFTNIRNVETWLLQYKHIGMLVYLGAQFLQIVICVIPGQALQFAAGYIWGPLIGLGLSLLGALIGTTCVYYISRILGHDAIHLLFGKKKVTDAIDQLNSRNGLILTFLIFLIPGIPKDLFTYAAGLSNIKLKPFLLLSIIARTPGMIGSLIIGNQVLNGGYTVAIVIAIIAVVIFIIGIIFRKQIMGFADRVCDRLLQ